MHINIDDISVFSQQWKMKLSSLACFKGLLMDCKHFGFFLNLLQVCSTSDDWGSALYLSLCLVYVYLCHHFGLIFILSIQSVKAMATHSSTLAWQIPWMEEPGGLQSMGSLGVGHDWANSLSCIGEGNGNPLQCSCLEDPRDGGAWWAAVYGVAQSRTRLKRLSSSTLHIS